MAASFTIGLKFQKLRDEVCSLIFRYIKNCDDLVRELVDILATSDEIREDMHFEKSSQIGILSISLTGFLESAALHLHFFTAAERLQVVQKLQKLLSESLMVAIEGAFSSIRISESPAKSVKNWKTYSKRYADSGRPLGAMLLQHAFVQMLVSCSAVQIVPAAQLQQNHVLQYLMSKRHPQLSSRRDAKDSLNQTLAEIAVEKLRILEDEADYLQLGSASQQRLAFAVKRHALTIYVTCAMVDAETMENEVLLSSLEDTLTDMVQMNDDDLASTVLMSLAIMAKTSSGIASSLARSVSRFVVQCGINESTAIVAARCLASILQAISQDAVITGLYSLGNVLSAGSGAERAVAPGETALSNSLRNPRYTKHSTGSAISFEVSGELETSAVYANVIRVIVGLSTACQDRKIPALALSMLIQKLGRISMNVDSQIVVEVAVLATYGTETDLKSLLKLYDRYSHDALVAKNPTFMNAVSFPGSCF